MILALAVLCGLAAVALGGRELVGRRGAGAALGRVAMYARQSAVAEPEAARPSRGVPGAAALGAAVARFSPGRDLAATALQLRRAGLEIEARSFLAVKAGLLLGGVLLGVLLGVASGALASVAFALFFGGIGFVVPDLVVSSRAGRRTDRMLSELPNALDLLAVIVEAGLGLDAALARYAATAKGPLADEIGLLAAELRVARSRVDAFHGFSERLDAPEAKSFVRAVVHADRLGGSLSRTLRIQADDARVRRQSVAEERANKTPIKMLFPGVLCIFPALFVVVLGPPILQFLHASL